MRSLTIFLLVLLWITPMYAQHVPGIVAASENQRLLDQYIQNTAQLRVYRDELERLDGINYKKPADEFDRLLARNAPLILARQVRFLRELAECPLTRRETLIGYYRELAKAIHELPSRVRIELPTLREIQRVHIYALREWITRRVGDMRSGAKIVEALTHLESLRPEGQ